MNLPKSPKDAEMSDVAIARQIITGIWPIQNGRKGIVIASAFESVRAIERSLSPQLLRERKRRWTERRVRSIIDNDPIRVEHYEMSDLEKMALKEARREYRESLSRAQRMAAFLHATDPDFHGPEVDRIREQFGALDRS